MRLLSVELRDYRIHARRRLELASGLTVLAGPNESGKSTFVEAVHRALFLLAKTSGEAREAMVSQLPGAGAPEVTVRFTAAGQSWELCKRFNKAQASVTLAATGAPQLSGAPAEERLASLLGAEAVGGKAANSQLRSRWAHLWVWQGSAGTDPFLAATEAQPSLVRRLQLLGGGAVVQSDLDQRLTRRFREAANELFTQEGRWRQPTEAAAARREWEATLQTLNQAEERIQQRSDASRRLETARATLDRLTAELPRLRAEALRAETDAARFQVLTQQREAIALPQQALMRDKVVLLDAEVRARTAAEQASRLVVQRAALMTELEASRLACAEAQRRFEAADAAVTNQQRQYTARSARRDRLRQWQTLAAKEADLASTRALLVRVQEVRTERRHLLEEAAREPVIERATLRRLAQIEAELNTTGAALGALGIRLHLTTATTPVTVAGVPLPLGESCFLTRPTTLQVGEWATFEIQPGAAQDLAERQAQLDRLTDALAAGLQPLGVGSVDAADLAYQAQQARSRKVELLDERLESLGAVELGSRLEAQELEVGGLRTQLGDGTEPAPLDVAAELMTLQSELALTLADADRLANLRTEADQVRGVIQRNVREQEEASLQLARAEQENLARLREIDAVHGLAPVREARLRQLTDQLAEAESVERRLTTELLQPDLQNAVADRARLQRAMDSAGREEGEARVALARAEAELLTEAGEDPEVSRRLAVAAVAKAEQRTLQLEVEGRATQRLAELFGAAESAAVRQFAEPLAIKAASYLEGLFGAGVRLRLKLQEGGFEGIELDRSASGHGVFTFEQLSGGAREQVALALRLAMAEILAADHDGCLPVVLDDAFTQSDPDRVRSLQRLLDRAAAAGLQILVLTCTPADYLRLGATTVYFP